MQTENRYYDITPRVLPADSEAEITIRSLYDHCRFAAGKPYTVQHYLMDDSPMAAKSSLAGTYAIKPDKADRLRFRSCFPGEQEHWVRVIPPPKQNAPAIDFRLFSLRPDLFGRRPFKGDFHMFEHHPFDAFELIGGYHRHELDSNQLQVAWYNDQRVKGRDTPVVGASDAHGCERGELFGWYYTIVFSRSLDDLLESVRQGYSVAVEALPGDIVRPHASYRLVKYTLFLAREILPFHDELCTEEGRLMLGHIAGNPPDG